MRKLRIALTIAAALVLGARAFAAPPASVNASYEIYRNKLLIASVQETFKRVNGSYEIVSTTSAAGVAALLFKERIVRTSRGTITAAGLRPQLYEEKKITSDKEKVTSAKFDWDKKIVTLTHGDKSEAAPLPAGTLDWSALYYQFMFQPPKQGPMQVSIADGRRLETYDYQSAGDVTITTPAGKFATAHLVRAKTGEKRTELWLAREQHYFPVQVRIEEDGVVLEQRLTAVSFH